MAENKVRFGLRNAHVAFRTADVAGEPQWETPEAVPGAVRFKPTPEGDTVKDYADDGIFFTAETNDGYSAEVEFTALTAALEAKMLNHAVDDNGAVIEDAEALPKPFALGFEIQGDVKGRRVWYYECTASRPDREEKTKEKTITPGHDVLKLTIVPIEVAGRKTPKAFLEPSATNAAAYDAFFSSVYTEVEVAG